VEVSARSDTLSHLAAMLSLAEDMSGEIAEEVPTERMKGMAPYAKSERVGRPGDLILMIRRCNEADVESIWAIINDGAQAYKATIPADRWEEPYMSREKLQHEIADGVSFWGYEESSQLIGVMGIQTVQDVTLIRHAYVRAGSQKRGIGAQLLSHLRNLSTMPVLIGTWADAFWAIHFYENHGFRVVEPREKERLLRTYWNVPKRQIETSVVLADQRWRESKSSG
jgi:N-acetylglutamate synthase-like GNAT family acetyltransferase